MFTNARERLEKDGLEEGSEEEPEEEEEGGAAEEEVDDEDSSKLNVHTSQIQFTWSSIFQGCHFSCFFRISGFFISPVKI